MLCGHIDQYLKLISYHPHNLIILTTVGVQDKDRMRNVKEKLEGENQFLVEKFKHLDLAQAALIKKHAGEVESLQEKYDREVIAAVQVVVFGS